MENTTGLNKGDEVIKDGYIATVTGFGQRYNRRGDRMPVVVLSCPDVTPMPIRVVGQQVYNLFPVSDLNIAY